MKSKNLGSLIVSLAFAAGIAAPAFALDYEAKPIMWCLQAPFRTLGAATGALVSGGISGPIDDGYHWSLKGTEHVAGKFGDEKGTGQIVAAVPIGGSTGLVLGSAHGVYRGFFHGWKKGWEKPFSRWSLITMEEQ